MKYPQFATALRKLGSTRKEIAAQINRSERQTDYYLSGNSMPPADITARFPELHEALRRDLGLAAEPHANHYAFAA